MNLTVNVVPKYNIEIGENILHKLEDFYKPSGKVLVVLDDNVDKYGYFEKLNKPYEKLVLPNGEKTKSFEYAQKILEVLLTKNFTRDDTLIALGGGVIGDLVGFVASIYMRGIKFVSIPTTLLSMVDSSVGGKTAINFLEYKNSIGAFYQPSFVLIDTKVLDTLEKRQFNNGMAEVIKYGCIYSKDLFYSLEKEFNLQEVIYKCLDLKRNVVEKDEKDLGLRKVLNFGHTIGHGIESYYNMEKYFHGEAVAIGMVKITKDEKMKNIIINMLLKYDLPIETDYDKSEVFQLMKNDKKAGKNNTIDIILLEEIGKAYIEKVSIDELKNYI